MLFAILAAGIVADLASKRWAFDTVGSEPVVLEREHLVGDPAFDPVGWGPRRALLPGDLLDLTLVLNPGAVFGIAANQRKFFIAFTLAALAAGVGVFAWYTTRRAWSAHVGIALVMAGGIGNLYDRLAFGRVRDFIQALPARRLPNGWTWPGTNNYEMFPWVFNVADVLLLVGMVMVMMYVRRRRRREQAAVIEHRDDAEFAAQS